MRKIMLLMSIICLTAMAAGCEENGMVVLMGDGADVSASEDACAKCGANQICEDGECKERPCNSDNECGEGGRCGDNEICGNSCISVCKNNKVALMCEDGNVREVKCEENEICDFGKCKLVNDVACNEKKSVCKNDSRIWLCQNGKFIDKPCEDGQKCINDKCVNNKCESKCEEDQVCIDNQCVCKNGSVKCSRDRMEICVNHNWVVNDVIFECGVKKIGDVYRYGYYLCNAGDVNFRSCNDNNSVCLSKNEFRCNDGLSYDMSGANAYGGCGKNDYLEGYQKCLSDGSAILRCREYMENNYRYEIERYCDIGEICYAISQGNNKFSFDCGKKF